MLKFRGSQSIFAVCLNDGKKISNFEVEINCFFIDHRSSQIIHITMLLYNTT